MTDVAIVDSGFVLALIDSDDQHHAKAWRLLNEPRWRFRVPPVIFVEVLHIRIRDAVSKDRQAHITQEFAESLLWLVGDEVPFRLEEMVLGDYRRVAELLVRYADSKID
jgi:predicted nucleic acid-binding protein